MGPRRDPVPPADAARAASSVREKFAAMAKEKPRPPRVRNLVWIAAGVAALAIAAAQFLGLAKNPVETRIREGVADRQAEQAARARQTPLPPAHAGFDDSVPVPAGLPDEVAFALEGAFAVAAKADLDVARRAVERLPALAAAAPDDRRREVRSYVLRRIEPLLRSGIDAPLAAEARAAAAEILTADPAADPGAPR